MRLSERTHVIEGKTGVFMYNSVNGEKCKLSWENYDNLRLALKEEETDARKQLNWFFEKGMIEEESKEAKNDCHYFSPTEAMLEEARTGIHISNLRLNVTHNCNLCCSYCFESNSKQYLGHQTMDRETAQKATDVFLQILKKNGRSEGNVRFFGGEPLLNYSLIVYLVNYVKSTRPADVQIRYVVNTNGTLITDEMAEFFHENDIQVVVSLDGVGKTNDYYRIDRDGKGSFERVDRGLCCLLMHHCSVDVATVVNETNLNLLGEIVDYVCDLNARFSCECGLALSYVHITHEETKTKSADRVSKIMEAIKKARQRGVNCYGGFTHQVFQNMMSPNGGRHCVCLGAELSVMPNGKIYPCDGLQIELGSIDAIDQALRSDEYTNLLRRTCGFEKKCHGCEIEYYCAGGCYADYLSDDGKPKNTCRDRKFQVLLFQELVREYLLS